VKNRYSFLTHLLLRDEPHPDTYHEFPRRTLWPQQPKRPWDSDLYSWVNSELAAFHPPQRLLVKLALRAPLTDADVEYLATLHSEGRYISDPQPSTFLFCLGRQSGKTTLAELLQRVFVRLGESSTCHSYPSRIRGLPLVSATGHLILDEMLTHNWKLGVTTRRQGSVFVGFFSVLPGHLPLVLPSNVPTMIVSLDTTQLRPDFPPHRDDYREFVAPKVSDIYYGRGTV